LREAPLALSAPGFRASLFRLLPGMTAPRHTHGGHEYTLVLEGGFADGSEKFDRGDFALVDSTRHHEQVADPEGCLCLVVLDAPVRLTGLLGALVNPFLRYL
jgi:putative transcriptional regulator